MSNLGDILRQVVCTPKHIPDDWQFYKLTDICSPKQWKTISSTEMTESGYPVFGANGFVGFYHEYNHEHEAVAITCRGNTCGTINRIPPRTYITGNSMALDDIKNDVITQDFLYYALKYRGVGDSISGSAQPQITGAGLRSIEFPAPPLPEQQKIATILSSVDDVIEKTRAQIDKLKDLKTGMMQELLTKGIGHTEFKDSPVGRIPVAWDVVNIESITTDVTYGLTVRPKYIDEGVPLVSGKECKDGWLDFSISNRISEVDFASLRTRALPSVGDVIMTKTGTIGRVALVRKHYPKFAISQNVALLKPEMSQVEPEYLLLLLTSQSVKEQIRLGVSTLSVPDLQLGTLKGFIVPLPSKNEQRSISSIINSLNDRLSGCEEKLCQYGLLKKALMQDLLTGKVRVKTQKDMLKNVE